ncbi:MAG: hypothetical protein K6E54_00700 [Bacteroidaceae bacterium]|nr:hypothetical protein [Bacteroidaceae bacterium]
MRLMIDIPDEMYKRIAVAPRCASPIDAYNDRDDFVKAIQNGTPISKDATNGDIIKAMFPDERGEHYRDIAPMHLMYDGLDYMKEFRTDWWNAPYKSEVKE